MWPNCAKRQTSFFHLQTSPLITLLLQINHSDYGNSWSDSDSPLLFHKTVFINGFVLCVLVCFSFSSVALKAVLLSSPPSLLPCSFDPFGTFNVYCFFIFSCLARKSLAMLLLYYPIIMTVYYPKLPISKLVLSVVVVVEALLSPISANWQGIDRW